MLRDLRAFVIATLVAGTSMTAAERSTLVETAKTADAGTLRTLIAKKADVNAADADGTTALHWAAYRDDLESVDLLLRAGAKVNAVTDLGVTPLYNASQNGSVAMVTKLIAAGANPNLALLAGETPLMVASRAGKTAVVEALISKGADLNARGTRGQTALMWAAAQEHPDVVKALLVHGADIHAKSNTWSEMMAVPPHGYLPYNRMIPHGSDTALMFAARAGDLSSAKLLVEAGANVNDVDAWGISATTLAAFSGFTDFVAFLLDKGANPNTPADFTALHCAIMRRDERMVAALLDHGADTNTPIRNWTPTRRSSKDYNFGPELVGATPFWLAARFLQPEVMRLLAKHGADPAFVHRASYVAGEGYKERKEATNALMAAAGLGNGSPWVDVPKPEREPLALAAIKLAVELGVDKQAANVDGRTAFDSAKALKYDSVVNFLK
ncbi:MAG: ankyrin repeat domain-containing protein [Vicinamibacterales bacterium]|nr:ankyrin repeat domain-containing protein [Vicinamibacterales bacterium]